MRGIIIIIIIHVHYVHVGAGGEGEGDTAAAEGEGREEEKEAELTPEQQKLRQIISSALSTQLKQLKVTSYTFCILQI